MLLSEQVRAARMLLDWNQTTLAERSGLGVATIKRLEAAAGPIGGNADSVWKIQSALEQGGIVFIASDLNGGPGVRLAKPYA